MQRKTSDSRARDNQGTGAIVVATAVAAVAVLVFHAIGSRSLGPDGFAPVAVLWTLMFLLHTVLLLPAEQHLTRALVVTRTPAQIAKVRRDMVLASLVALLIGVIFTATTLDRFFDGSTAYIAFIAAIVVNRSVMVTGRGLLAGHRRFAQYGATIALEAIALLVGGVVVAAIDGTALAYGVVIALAPLATLLARPFARGNGGEDHHLDDAQPGSFLAWLVAATAASQLIIAGGPIAISFVGGDAAAVSVFFTSFALLRGPLTSAYNLVARVLPDFTALAHGEDPHQLWRWAPRIALGGSIAALVGALGAGLLLRPIVDAIYGVEFSPPVFAAILGGAGVGLGLGALFAAQVYTAAGLGARLTFGWTSGLVAALGVLALAGFDPVERVALAFAVGEGVGLVMLGLVLPLRLKATGVTATVPAAD
ncbi:MAG: hypothetical protein U9N84_01200 [Actinomycetota bacterium]|nr:hypothetical protein [Actinomycetota bacterium]